MSGPSSRLSSPPSVPSEIFPYLVVVIGLENVLVLTRSVVSTPVDLEVKLRIAQGNRWGRPCRASSGGPRNPLRSGLWRDGGSATRSWQLVSVCPVGLWSRDFVLVHMSVRQHT